MELLTRILWLLPLIAPIWTSRINDRSLNLDDYSDPSLSVSIHKQHGGYKPSIQKTEVQVHNPSTITEKNKEENNKFPSTIRFSSKEELKEYLLNSSRPSSKERSLLKDRLHSNKDDSTKEELETHEELSHEKESTTEEKLKTKSLYKQKTDEVKLSTSAIEERQSYSVSVSDNVTSGNLPVLSEVPFAGKITQIKVSVEYSNSSEAPSLELIRDDSGLFFISGEDFEDENKGINLHDYIDINSSEGHPDYGVHLLNITEPLYENDRPLVQGIKSDAVDSSIINSDEGIETIIDFSPNKTTEGFLYKKPSVSKSKLKLLMDKPKKIMTIIKAVGVDHPYPEDVSGILVPTDDGKQEVFVSDNILAGSAFLLDTLQQQAQDDSAYVISPEEEEYLTSESRIIESSPVPMKGMPYQFGWIVDDEATANFQTRQEEGDNNGVVTGCYQVLEPTGLVRTVQYIADDGGFRILSLTNGPDKTPCPGLKEAGRLSQASATNGKAFERPIQSLPPPTAAPPPPPPPPPPPQPPITQPLPNYNFQQSFSSSSSNYSSSNHSESSNYNFISDGYNYPIPSTTFPPPPPPPTAAYRPAPTTSYRTPPPPPVTTSYRPPPIPAPTYAPTTSYGPLPPQPSTISYPSSTYRPPYSPTPQPPSYFSSTYRPPPTPTPQPPRPTTAYTLSPPPPPSYQPFTRPPPPVRVPITTSAPVSSAASLSEYDLAGSAQQAWMTEYLENLSQQIHGSYSNSSTDTSYFGSPSNKINFPFVLIPITTFLDLQNKGALEGNIQTFGAYISPPLKTKELKSAKPSSSYLPPVSGGKAVHTTTTNHYNTTQTKVQQVKHRQEGVNSVQYQVSGVQGQAPQVTQQAANHFKSQQSSEESNESSSSSSSSSATNVQYNGNGGHHLSQQKHDQKQSKAISRSSNSQSSSFNNIGNVHSSYLPPYPGKPSITFPDSPPVGLTYGTPRTSQISTSSPTVTSQATSGAVQQSYQQIVKSSHNEENSSSSSSNKEVKYNNAGNQQQISQQYNNQQSSESSSEDASSSSSLIQSNFGNVQSAYLPPKPSINIESAYLPPKPSITLDSAYLPPSQQTLVLTSPQPTTVHTNILLDLPSYHFSAPASSVSYAQQSSNSNESEQSSSSESKVSSNLSGSSTSHNAQSASSDSSKSAKSSKSSSQYSSNNGNTNIQKSSSKTSSSNSATNNAYQKSYNYNSGVVQEYLLPIVSSSPPTYASEGLTLAPYVNPALSYLPPVKNPPTSVPNTPSPYVNPSLSYLPPVNSNSPAIPIAKFSYQLPQEGIGGKVIKNYALSPPSPHSIPNHSDTDWTPFSPNYAPSATPKPVTIKKYSLQSSSSESSKDESSSQQSQQYVGSLQSAIPVSTSQSGAGNANNYYSSSSSQSSSSASNSQASNNQQYSGTWAGSNSPPQFIQFPGFSAFAPPKTPQISDQLEVKTWNSQNYGR